MKLRSVVSLILALVLLMACASIGVAETAKTKVTIWYTFTEEQEAYLTKAAADFSAISDKYEVEALSQPRSDFKNTTRTAVLNGVGPDIVFDYASYAAEFVDDGLVADLSQYVYAEESGIADFDTSISQGVMDGEVYGFSDGLIHYLPAYTTGPILYYNKTLYDELGLTVPATWAEMEANCKVIFEKKGIAGLGFDGLTDCIQMFIMDCADYIDVENKCVLFDTPEVRERINWLVECAKAGYFMMQPTADYFSNDFNSGIVATYIGSCAGYPHIYPDGFEYEMAPMPAGDWYPSWNRGPIVFYYEDDARAEGAYEFIKYFTSSEVNLGWVKAVVALSPYTWTQALPEYQEYLAQDTPAVQSLKAVSAHLDIAGSLPNVTGATTVRNAITNAVVKAANGEMSVDDAWTEAVILCNTALKGE